MPVKLFLVKPLCIFIRKESIRNLSTMAIQTIAQNKQYVLAADTDKNRAYLRINGYWRNVDAVSDYISDWKKTLALMKKGFTLLTDASEMKTHPQDVRKLHEEAQGLLLKAGVSKIAEVIKDDIAEMQLDALAQTTKFPKQNFRTVEDAERWLDLP